MARKSSPAVPRHQPRPGRRKKIKKALHVGEGEEGLNRGAHSPPECFRALPDGRGNRPRARDVSLEIQRGEYVAIMGVRLGKSTMMNLIGCLDTAHPAATN